MLMAQSDDDDDDDLLMSCNSYESPVHGLNRLV